MPGSVRGSQDTRRPKGVPVRKQDTLELGTGITHRAVKEHRGLRMTKTTRAPDIASEGTLCPRWDQTGGREMCRAIRGSGAKLNMEDWSRARKSLIPTNQRIEQRDESERKLK